MRAKTSGPGALGCAAMGAGLMWWLDPGSGRRRRAFVRDKLRHGTKELGRAVSATRADLAHRARGLESRLHRGERRVHDDVLVERVRAKLGHVICHSRAIEVRVQDGRVTLEGDILARNLHRVLSTVRRVRGVRELENHLAVHATAEGIPSLRDDTHARASSATAVTDWPPSARFLAGAGGVVLAWWGLRHAAHPLGLLASVTGAGLTARSMTNLPLKRLTEAYAEKRRAKEALPEPSPPRPPDTAAAPESRH